MVSKKDSRSWSSQGRDGLPEQLRMIQGARMDFDNARDPSLKAQREAMRITEAKRREEQGEGSTMVKLHKPFPELRPKSVIAQQNIRHSFNNRWHAEQKRTTRKRKHKDAFDKADHEKSQCTLKHQQSSERQLER